MTDYGALPKGASAPHEPDSNEGVLTALPTRNLDVLRATAVLSVLASHMLTFWNLRLPADAGPKLGTLGVLLFFVHTSLVPMSSLEWQGMTKPGWMLDCYVRRAFRIYPLAMLTVGLTALLEIPEHVASPPVEATALTARTLISDLPLAQNVAAAPNILGVLWSLPLELQMYMLLSFCLLVANRRAREVGLILGLFVIIGLFIASEHARGYMQLSMLAYARCFTGGVLAFHLIRRGVRPMWPSWLWPSVILGAGLLVIAMDPTWTHPETGWVPCLLLGAIIPVVAHIPASPVAAAAHRI